MIQRGWGQIRKSLSQYDFSSVQVNQKAREWCISPVSALSRLTALCKHDAFWLFQFKSKTLCKLWQKIKVFLSHICFTLSGQISKKAVKHICTTIFYTKINRKKGLSFKVYASIVTTVKKKKKLVLILSKISLLKFWLGHFIERFAFYFMIIHLKYLVPPKSFVWIPR